MKEVNCIDDFIKTCMVRGWIVNKSDINNQIDIYNKMEEEISFEEKNQMHIELNKLDYI